MPGVNLFIFPRAAVNFPVSPGVCVMLWGSPPAVRSWDGFGWRDEMPSAHHEEEAQTDGFGSSIKRAAGGSAPSGERQAGCISLCFSHVYAYVWREHAGACVCVRAVGDGGGGSCVRLSAGPTHTHGEAVGLVSLFGAGNDQEIWALSSMGWGSYCKAPDTAAPRGWRSPLPIFWPPALLQAARLHQGFSLRPLGCQLLVAGATQSSLEYLALKTVL